MNTKIPLYLYSASLAWLSNKQLGTDIQYTLLHDSKKTIRKAILPKLALEYDASLDSLKHALNGNQEPLMNLYQAADDIGIGSKLRNYVKECKKHLLQPQEAVHDHSKPDKKSSVQEQLLYYINALCYMQGTTLKSVATTMSFKEKDFVKNIKHGTKRDLVNIYLAQLPFILQTSMKDMKRILGKDYSPLRHLEARTLRRIMDRETLIKYINLLLYLRGLPLQATLINSIRFNSRSTLAPKLSKFFRQLNVKLNIKKLLHEANIGSNRHAYLPKMCFQLYYHTAPVGLTRNAKDYTLNKKKVVYHIHKLKMILKTKGMHYMKISNHTQRKRLAFTRLKPLVTRQVWKILTAWHFVYGFDNMKFLADNTQYYTRQFVHTRIIQDNAHKVMREPNDWLVVLKKLHTQLKAINTAVDLKSVADSVYGKYTRIEGFDRLSNPKARNYHYVLANMNPNDNYNFIATFLSTDITRVNSDSHHPCIVLHDIEYNGNTIAKQMKIPYTSNFRKLGNLQEGDIVKFNAKPRKYWIGNYTKNTIACPNYKLAYPTNAVIIDMKNSLRKQSPVPNDHKTLIGYCIKHNQNKGYDFSTNKRAYQYIRSCTVAYQKWATRIKASRD